MQKKDIVPTPTTSKAANFDKIKKDTTEHLQEQDSLVYLVPPPKKLIKEDTPITSLNQNNQSYCLDQFLDGKQERQETLSKAFK